MTTKQRIIGLSRFAVLVLAILLGISFYSGNAEASSVNGKATFTYVTVEAGQSLWDLAEHYAGNSTSNQDWIASLVELNNLSSGELQPGQRLALPN